MKFMWVNHYFISKLSSALIVNIFIIFLYIIAYDFINLKYTFSIWRRIALNKCSQLL